MESLQKVGGVSRTTTLGGGVCRIITLEGSSEWEGRERGDGSGGRALKAPAEQAEATPLRGRPDRIFSQTNGLPNVLDRGPGDARAATPL